MLHLSDGADLPSGEARAASPSCSRGSRRASPARNNFDTTQVMTETSGYPASASRETPAVTPTRGQQRTPSAVDSARPRRSGAVPLSVQELNGCPTSSAACGSRAGAASTTKAAPTNLSVRSAGRGGSRGGETPGHAGNVVRGPAGSLYTVRAGQHPLYTGGASGRAQQTRSKQSPPPPSSDGPELMISAENNTVRSLRGVNTHSSTPPSPLPSSSSQPQPTMTKRKSVIEQVAAATGIENVSSPTPTATYTRTDVTPFTVLKEPKVRFQLPASEGGAIVHAPATLVAGSPHVLEPLGLREGMKMHLQPPPSNLTGDSALVKKLAADALVLRPPEKTKDGADNAVFAQLSAFKMPHDGPLGSSTATTPQAGAAGSAAATTENNAGASAAVAGQQGGAPAAAQTLGASSVGAVPPPPPSSSANANATAASVPLPPPPAAVPTTAVAPPPPVSTGPDGAAAKPADASQNTTAPTATTTTTTAAAGTASPAQAALATSVNANAAAAAGAAQPQPRLSLPILHASLREPTSEEKAAVEADRLLEELWQHKQHQATLGAEWQSGASGKSEQQHRFHADPLLLLHSGDGTNAAGADVGLAAVAMQRQLNKSTGLYGWHRPPPNVLLPDPSQPPATWAVLQAGSEQAAQQAAATQAIAEASKHIHEDQKHHHHHDGRRDNTEGTGTAAAGRDEAGLSDYATSTVDYHAPFQCVLQPEAVENVHAIPDISGIAVDTGVEAREANLYRGADRTAAATMTRDADGAMVKSFASQAVVLRDPLSLLACEHLAEDTVGMVARRRAYLTAMSQLSGALRGASLPPPKNRPSILHSVLQPATPPGEVFCELSYQAKVLLSAVLYMRALGALPTLLRVGPLTEYSPIIDKENCIELVFYNPSEEERGKQSAQEAQQERRRRQSLDRVRSGASRGAGAKTFSHKSPSTAAFAFSGTSPLSPAAASRARGRSQPPGPSSDRHRETSPDFRGGSALRHRSRSHSVNASPSRRPPPFSGGGGAAAENSAEDLEELVHLVPSASLSRRSPLRCGNTSANGGFGFATPQPQHQQQQPSPSQRRQSAVEGLLLQSLSSAALRRSSSTTAYGNDAPPLNGRAEPVFGVTSHTSQPTPANFTSVAGPLLRSAEPSFLIDDVSPEEAATPASSVYRRPNFYNESGGSWLQRSPSLEAAARVNLQRWTVEARGKDASSVDGGVGQRQRRGSECTASGLGAGGIPHVAEERRGGAASARLLSTSSITSPSLSGLAALNGAGGKDGPRVALRRSSVQFAVEDLKREKLMPDVAASTTHAASLPSSPLTKSAAALAAASSSSPTSKRPASKPHPFAALPPSVQFESNLDAVLSPARNAGESRAPKPASVHGAGNPRFPEGERELCVVVRAVVAQKSLVYAFGKSETVHVLPPLPPRSTDDDADQQALLRKQVEQKRADLHRLSTDASNNPLLKFLGGSGRRSYANGGDAGENVSGEESTTEEEKRKVSLRERARRAAAAARQHLQQQQEPVSIDAQGRPTIDDYGDLVVAFVLSKHASELSGSVPDMMELESLRYRIFSLQGYNTADPSGMQAVRAAAAAAAAGAAGGNGGGGATSLPQSPAAGADVRSTGFAAFSRASTRDGSPLESGQNRLQRQLSSYTAFQSLSADARLLSPEASLAMEASASPSRASMRGLQHRRSSFFESALRKTDPAQQQQQQQQHLLPLRSNSNDPDGSGECMSEFEYQQLKVRQQQQQRAEMQTRYPLYRASSVAESTLEAFTKETRAAVSAARREQRRRLRRSTDAAEDGVPSSGAAAPRSGSDVTDVSSRELLAGKRVNTPPVAGQTDAIAVLQEAERDLLRFRPMNLNSFHHELVEAVQYSLDIQTRQRTEKVLHAFHM